MNKCLKIILAVGTAAIFISCGGTTEDTSGSGAALPDNTPLGQAGVVDNESANDILKVAIGSKDHSTLVAAVQAAHIEHILSNAGPLTVFAPVNSAFEALPPGTVESLLEPDNIGLLTTILTRHAAPGSFDIEKLKKEARKGRKLYMATGDYLDVTTEGDDVFVHGIKVLASVQTSNGIINVIDQVILPKN
jgi:uncharacterized surface protein with fasciclin (FAS1) repeats